MQERDLAEILGIQKKIYAKLNEVMQITRELAEAVDREDQVSLKMLISARKRLLLELQELRAFAKLKRCDLNSADEEQFDCLFSGAPPKTPAEVAIANQLALNHRLLERVVEQDRRVNQKFCREKSYYLTCKKR